MAPKTIARLRMLSVQTVSGVAPVWTQRTKSADHAAVAADPWAG